MIEYIETGVGIALGIASFAGVLAVAGVFLFLVGGSIVIGADAVFNLYRTHRDDQWEAFKLWQFEERDDFKEYAKWKVESRGTFSAYNLWKSGRRDNE